MTPVKSKNMRRRKAKHRRAERLLKDSARKWSKTGKYGGLRH